MITNVYIGVVAQAAGTVDAITATYLPAPTVLADKMLLWFRATGANTTTTPTFSPNGLTAKTIVKQGGQALAAGDIPGVGAVMEVCYDETAGKWELINPANKPKYKVYSAIIAQSGTNAPTVIEVLENTISGNMTYTYGGVGVYGISNSANAFTEYKTAVILSPVFNSTSYSHCISNIVDTDITFQIFDTTDGTNVDGAFSISFIEIRVYP